jgi:outer membrane immunogenic protein
MKLTQKLAIAGTAAIGALAFAGAALAADLPARTYTKAPMMSPVFSWTGFYVGGHVGAGWGTTETDANIGAATFSVNNGPFQTIPGNLGLNLPIGQTQMNGFLGGVQAGYNWQSGIMVFGVEGDFTWSGLKGGTACILVLHCDSEVKWIGDITGRVGVTVGERALLYVKGGAAWADSRYSVSQGISIGGVGGGGFAALSNNGFPGASASLAGAVDSTRFGGVLGAGIEYGFMPGWSAKLEYDYFDFGKKDLNIPIVATGALAGGNGGTVAVHLPINVNEQVHTIRVGANYHF